MNHHTYVDQLARKNRTGKTLSEMEKLVILEVYPPMKPMNEWIDHVLSSRRKKLSPYDI